MKILRNNITDANTRRNTLSIYAFSGVAGGGGEGVEWGRVSEGGVEWGRVSEGEGHSRGRIVRW